jgi:hypothetical protein
MGGGGGKMGLQGQTSNFVDPTPFVQYEQNQGALGQMSNYAGEGLAGSTMAAQGLAGNDFQAASNMWSALAGEQGAQMSETGTLANYTNQANALGSQEAGSLGGIIGALG